MGIGAKPNRELTGRQVLLAITFQAVLFTALGVGIWHFTDRPIDRFLIPQWQSVLRGFALGGAFTAVAATAFYGFPRFSEKMVRLQSETYRFLGGRLSFAAFVWISICAGVSEEALFRAGLQTLLTDYLGAFAGILLSSIVFALIHLSKPIITALLVGISIVFGVIYWLTNDLLLVMIGHAVYDVFALAYLQREMRRLGLLEEKDASDASPQDTGENARADNR